MSFSLCNKGSSFFAFLKCQTFILPMVQVNYVTVKSNKNRYLFKNLEICIHTYIYISIYTYRYICVHIYIQMLCIGIKRESLVRCVCVCLALGLCSLGKDDVLVLEIIRMQ